MYKPETRSIDTLIEEVKRYPEHDQQLVKDVLALVMKWIDEEHQAKQEQSNQ